MQLDAMLNHYRKACRELNRLPVICILVDPPPNIVQELTVLYLPKDAPFVNIKSILAAAADYADKIARS